MAPPTPAVWLTTLGCAKNQVDSEKLVAVLTEAGYELAASPEEADVVMVNTCAFVEAAREESVDAVLDLAERRAEGSRLVVLGCMAQRYGNELSAALPEADAVVGMEAYPELVGRLDRLTGWHPVRVRPSPRSRMDILDLVARPAPRAPYAYVKIAEGCDKRCAFCAIPQFRGPQRSRPPTTIREEIAGLVVAGAGEIVLVAQDLAAYGRDIDAPGDVVDLIRFVSDVEGLRRLRLHYLHPREIRPALIEEITANTAVADYFDLSLQHASGRLLRAMHRPGDGDEHLRLVRAIREAAPDAALRSSFIVGFPGETEADVEELAAFLRAARLDWGGFFPFSPEEGTAAASYPGRIPEAEIQARLRYLQGLQEEITAERNALQVGKTMHVVVDRVEEGLPVARSFREAPEIDGVVLLDRGEPGAWLDVEITGSYGADLVGRVVG